MEAAAGSCLAGRDGQATASSGASSGKHEGISPRKTSAGRQKLGVLWAGEAAREAGAGAAGHGGLTERPLRGAEGARGSAPVPEGGGRKGAGGLRRWKR